MPNNPRGQVEETADASFADILNEFESTTRAARQDAGAPAKGKAKGKPSGPPPRRGTVAGISGDFVLIDYGVKSEGVIPSADLLDAEGNLSVKRGDTFEVAVTGRDRSSSDTASGQCKVAAGDFCSAFEGSERLRGCPLLIWLSFMLRSTATAN